MLDDTPMPPRLGRHHGVDMRSALTPTVDVLQSLAKDVEELMDGEFPRVETEFIEARRLWRSFNATATAKADTWFNGSETLRQLANRGTLDRTLLAIWRLTDLNNPNSVNGALSSVGRNDLASIITSSEEVKFIRYYVENKVLSARDHLLNGKSTHIGRLEAGELEFGIVSRVLDLCSRTYMQYRHQSVDYLDPYRQYREVFEDAFRDRGIPVVDFPPSEIFSID